MARSYKDIANKFNLFNDKKFIWITDGRGWLTAKAIIKNVYDSIEIYNLNGIDAFIHKIKYEKNI